MAIVTTQQSANLSAEYLRKATDWSSLLRSDYISRDIDLQALFNNDVEIDSRLVIAEGQIVALTARVTQNEIDIAALDARVTQNESDIAANAADIATNAADILANSGNISSNTSAIATINDGRYEPQFGTGSPEGVVTANRSRTYFDTSVPTFWVNSTIGATTGWVQIV